MEKLTVKELVEVVNNKFVRPTKRDRYVAELNRRGLDIDGEKLTEKPVEEIEELDVDISEEE